MKKSELKKIIKEEISRLLKETPPEYNPILTTYTPHSFPPDLNSLNSEEHKTVMNDLRSRRLGLLEYIQFLLNMLDEPIYKSIFNKLITSNQDKINFVLDQEEILQYKGPTKAQKFKHFYEKYQHIFPNWAHNNYKFYQDTLKYLKSSFN
jgi:hypothetical protein